MWEKAQEWEKGWHGTVSNTLYEEQKQIIYADRMGLSWVKDHKTPYNLDCNNKSIIDIGGGPCSILLKAINHKGLVVIDPLEFPCWVYQR